MYSVPYSVQLVCVIVWTPPTLILPFFPSCPHSSSCPPSSSLALPPCLLPSLLVSCLPSSSLALPPRLLPSLLVSCPPSSSLALPLRLLPSLLSLALPLRLLPSLLISYFLVSSSSPPSPHLFPSFFFPPSFSHPSTPSLSSFILPLLFPSVFSSSPLPPSLHPLYLPLHSPPQARHAGQHKKKWLLVNVQDSTEFASQVLNCDVWSNHNVKDIIRQHFLFWQVCACALLNTDETTCIVSPLLE